ncbi:2'-5' RNA ligase [Scopulibacillus daqui]|uniref:2'-5' RNA ligase n=2 Tax=Scopulibacillus daqui TaxID=1469162 RepID=A0ABS2Q3B7_9BACL|nr:2'-5' RNA ligase [Scopulibacillus daqui]
MNLPAEITVAGSSGVGILECDQDPTELFSTLKEFASKTTPIKAFFGEVMQFPYTNIFFFSLQNKKPFRELHEEITKSKIHFSENQFPYKPHCTHIRPNSPI